MSKQDLEFTHKLADAADKISMARFGALDLKIDRLSYALKKSDSALAAAITEIRIMNTMRKL